MGMRAVSVTLLYSQQSRSDLPPCSPNGIRFVATATSGFAKKWEPKEGDIVSFKHHGFLLATKKPKFPTIYRIRSDLKWDDVVNNWQEQKPPRVGEGTFLFCNEAYIKNCFFFHFVQRLL